MQRVAITTSGARSTSSNRRPCPKQLGRDGFPVVPFDGRGGYLRRQYLHRDRQDRCGIAPADPPRPASATRRRRSWSPAVMPRLPSSELREMPGGQPGAGKRARRRGSVELLKEIGDEQRVLVSDISLERKAGGSPWRVSPSIPGPFSRSRTAATPSAPTASSPTPGGRSRSVPLEEVLPGIRALCRERVSGRWC